MFCKIEMKVSFVHSQQFNCFILPGCGSIMAWGWNEHGICGTGDEINVHIPGVVLADSCVIGCGGGHSFALINR